jgi:hypothetical protein
MGGAGAGASRETLGCPKASTCPPAKREEPDRRADPGKEPESMRRLPRRLALWAGAAAIAAGGFAFMASGVTDQSSASEAAGNVTGYTASTIHYTLGVDNTCVNTNGGNADNSWLCALTFKLTSVATTTNANGQPAHVEAYLEKPTGKEVTGTWSFTTCQITGAWTSSGGEAGYGKFKCTFKKLSDTGFITKKFSIVTIGSVDIEANQ